jgi:hypothetical protein
MQLERQVGCWPFIAALADSSEEADTRHWPMNRKCFSGLVRWDREPAVWWTRRIDMAVARWQSPYEYDTCASPCSN